MNPKRYLKTFVLIASLLTGFAASSQITVTITSLTYDSTDFKIKATVRSTYQLDTVFTTFVSPQLGISAPMTFVANNNYQGKLPLTGLPEGTYSISVIARDVFGLQVTGSATIIYDIPPKVIVETPLDHSTARPKIRVKAKCLDSNPGCTLEMPWYNYGVKTTDSLDQVLDLSEADGNLYLLKIVATDSKGQHDTANVTVYVETSPYLKEYYAANDFIADIKNNKLLVAKGSYAGQGNNDVFYEFRNYRIRDMSTGVETLIPYNGFYPRNVRSWLVNQEADGHNGLFGHLPFYLYDGGVYFYSQDSVYPPNQLNGSIYQWNGSTLNLVSHQKPQANSVRVAGNYGTFRWIDITTTSLGFTDMLAGSTTLWSGRNFGFRDIADVAENGVLVIGRENTPTNHNVMRIQNGNMTYVTDTTALKILTGDPLTDGKRVVYAANNKIQLYDGNTTTQLAANTSALANDFAINKNYVAYRTTGSVGQSLLWVRDTLGNNKQMTFFNISSQLETLGINGEIMFNNKSNNNSNQSGQKRYWEDTSRNIKAIGSANIGRAYYDNGWYVVIGRTIFKVDTTGIVPNTVSSFSMIVQNNIDNKFNREDFRNNFYGSGVLMKIKILEMPKKGTLFLNGSSSVNVGTEIPVYDLDELKYRANAGYTGPDSMRWTGSNNFTAYAATDALVRINVSAPIRPIVTGMQPEYCSASPGIKTAKIINLPSATSGITVTVRQDSTTILPVAADSTFSFTTDIIPASHRITVTYSSAAGTFVSTYNYINMAAWTPRITSVTAQPGVASSLSDIVNITATGLYDGPTPIWTLSKDSTFNTFIAQGSNSTWQFPASAHLVPGVNKFYIRMQTSIFCYTRLYGKDSVEVILTLPVPPTPIVTGIAASYCSNAGLQKGKITNWPRANIGATVSVKLDGDSIAVQASDSTFTINPATVGAGNHTIVVEFKNVNASKTTTINFSVTAVQTPDVNVSSNVADISDPAQSVVITATPVAGIGTVMRYTFANNRTFTHPIVNQSSNNVLTLTGADLSLGDNMLYVAMYTNYPCATIGYAIDSIFILRSARVGIADPDFPNTLIAAAPNPIKSNMMVYGLQAGKTYTISVYNLQGTLLKKVKVMNQRSAGISMPALTPGTYMVNIFDETKGRFIGTIRIIKE